MRIPDQQPLSPGEILKEEFMDPAGLTQIDLATRAGVQRQRINEIINGRREITPDTALRFERLFGVPAEFWLECQLRWDLWWARQNNTRREEYRALQPLKGSRRRRSAR